MAVCFPNEFLLFKRQLQNKSEANPGRRPSIRDAENAGFGMGRRGNPTCVVSGKTHKIFCAWRTLLPTGIYRVSFPTVLLSYIKFLKELLL